MKVTVRTKALKDGIHLSIYLDYYPAIIHPLTGKLTRREFLETRLLADPRTPVHRKHNKETLQMVEQIRAERQLDIQAGKFGFLPNTNTKDFIEYFQACADKMGKSSRKNYKSVIKHFKAFAGEKFPAKLITADFCEKFRNHLLNDTEGVGINSALGYFVIFKVVVAKGKKENMIPPFPLDLDPVKPTESHKEYLTYEELIKLKDTPCTIPVLKSAAIFSALTGLRHCDILKMVWIEIWHSAAEGDGLTYKQQKTGTVEVMPLTPQVRELMGERRGPEDLVFQGLKYSTLFTTVLKQWVLGAGIKKKITFHCMRHTFATMQLTFGTDIYTVSKLLGHKSVATTAIYGKIISQVKRDAVNKIKI